MFKFIASKDYILDHQNFEISFITESCIAIAWMTSVVCLTSSLLILLLSHIYSFPSLSSLLFHLIDIFISWHPPSPLLLPFLPHPVTSYDTYCSSPDYCSKNMIKHITTNTPNALSLSSPLVSSRVFLPIQHHHCVCRYIIILSCSSPLSFSLSLF